MSAKKRVELAYAYKNHKADDTVDLPVAEANDLLFAGRARLAADQPAKKAAPAKKTTAKKAAETPATPAAPKEQ